MWIRGTGEPDTCDCGAVYLEKPFSEARRKELGQRARELEEQHGVEIGRASCRERV